MPGPTHVHRHVAAADNTVPHPLPAAALVLRFTATVRDGADGIGTARKERSVIAPVLLKQRVAATAAARG